MMPLSDPEHSHLSKLFWAGENAEQFVSEAEDAMTNAVRAVAILRDEQAKDLVFVAAPDLPQVPWHWHHQVADVISNLRSALEHLATALAKAANGGQPLDTTAAKAITFPIYPSRHQFKSKEGSIKRHFQPADWARIEELQPYNATNAGIWGQGVGSYTPHWCPLLLDVIEKLAAKGRHQILQPVGFAVVTSRTPTEVDGRAVIGSSDFVQFMHPGEEFGRWHFDQLPAQFPTLDQVSEYLSLRLHLGEEYYGLFDFERGGLVHAAAWRGRVIAMWVRIRRW